MKMRTRREGENINSRSSRADRTELYYRTIITLSVIIDLLATVYFLSNGVVIVFQNIFYFPIVLASYRYRWRGAYFSVVLSISYLLIFISFYQDIELLFEVLARSLIFIMIGFVVAFLSDQLHQERKKEKVRYQNIFSAPGSGMIAVVDNDRVIVESNARFSDFFGEKGNVGGKIEEFLEPKVIERAMGSLVDGKEIDGIEIVVSCLKGEKRTCLITISRLNPGELVLSVSDITEFKQVEDALKEASKKMNLLSNITRHDINNQLTVLTGNLTLLEKGELDDMSCEHLRRAEAAAESISGMIRFTKEYQDIGVNASIWQDVRSLVAKSADQDKLGRVRLINEVPAGMEMMADPLIVKVFQNLVGNAVRHGDKVTTIHFSVQMLDGSRAIICEDDGIGIPAEMKKVLFTKGFGKDHGFGLFLSREILSITNITIEEIGVTGQGAKFVMKVPANAFRMAK